MTISRRLRNRLCGDDPTSAGAIFNYDRLTERLGERLGDDSRRDVSGIARRRLHDQLDRPGWISVGMRALPSGKADEENRHMRLNADS